MSKYDLARYQQQRHRVVEDPERHCRCVSPLGPRRRTSLIVGILLLLSLCGDSLMTEAFPPVSNTGVQNKFPSTRWTGHFMAPDPENNKDFHVNPITKASWYAVEWFGQAFGGTPKASDDNVNDGPPRSMQETLQRLETDNERAYFLSGQVDAEIYDPECVFKDPFVSFAGRDRFITNLEKLGSFTTKYNVKVIQAQTQVNDTTVQTKFMVKLELNLPWKPILAWPWGVTYRINPQTYLVQEHEESWDIEPWEGVLQIFRKPTLKL